MKTVTAGLTYALVIAVSAAGQAQEVTNAHDREIAAEISRFVDSLTTADEFSGVVLLARDGKAFFQKAYGLASIRFGVPNNLDTRFNLGSMNKMFTAVAIGQLADAGKLSFADPVGKHLPDYPNDDVAKRVTIHHLLTHTSGMGNYFGYKGLYMESARSRWIDVEDYDPLYVDEPLAFDPGTRWAYSNSGFMLLGRIVEAVSGQDYFEYIREHVYAPADMSGSDSYRMDEDVPNLAIGYTRMGPNGPRPGPRKNNLYLHVLKGGPAGGGFSNAPDLLRFANALEGHVLLSAEMTRTLTTGQVDVPSRGNASAAPPRYGYGFMEVTVNGHRVFGHGGGFMGINSQLDMYPDLPYTVVVMSNFDPPAAQRVADQARKLMTASRPAS